MADICLTRDAPRSGDEFHAGATLSLEILSKAPGDIRAADGKLGTLRDFRIGASTLLYGLKRVAQGDAVGKPIEVNRTEVSAAALREVAASRRDGAVVRRLLAIALILEGHSRTGAARLNGMDRQTLRDWVHRYNEEGIAGLRSRASPGRPAALSEQQMEELRIIVLEEPDPERNGVIRWRCADLSDEIAARWSVRLRSRSGWLTPAAYAARFSPQPGHGAALLNGSAPCPVAPLAHDGNHQTLGASG